MPPKKSETDSGPPESVKRARGLLLELIELLQKPKVKNDSVVRVMLGGIAPKISQFETSSQAVAVLRNAGCLGNDKGMASQAPMTSGNPGKAKATEKVKVEKTKQEPKKKLRGFPRTLDAVFEAGVVQGRIANPEEHYAAIAIRELRKDPERIIKLRNIKGIYKDVTYSNGKAGHVLEKLEIKLDGSPKFDETKGGAEGQATKVKDIGDWDLLALERPKVLLDLSADVNWTPDSGDPGRMPLWDGLFPGAQIEASDLPSLKGTETLKYLLSLNPMLKADYGDDKDMGYAFKDDVLKLLRKENFWRAGPSPTLYFAEYKNYLPAEIKAKTFGSK
jgi:hypothetical protein